MNEQERSGEDEGLSKLLREWHVEASVAPGFQEQVWRRIELAEGDDRVTVWMGLRRLVDVLLPRPKFALAYVTALAVLGVAAGAIAGQIRERQVARTLGERYVQSIDPYHVAGGIQ
jgi:hypothetical protein